MKIFLFSCFLLLSQYFYSQQIKGRVVSDSVTVNQVLIINITSQEKTYSNSYGEFLVNANIGDEIRFLKDGYERRNVVIKNREDLIINLMKAVIEIDAVEIKKKLTGDLAKDSRLFNENRKKVILNNDLKVYFKAPSSEELLKPQQGEFVQPVGEGFTFGKIDNKWTLADLVEWIRKNMTDEYFISLGINFQEINPFLFYSLQSFGTKNILKYGYCSDEDVGNLKLHFEITFKKFRNK